MSNLYHDNATHLECIDPSIGALLAQYEIGSLSGAELTGFEEHLIQCDHCRQEVTQMYAASSLLHANREEILSELKQQGVTYESTLYLQREQENATKLKPASSRSRSRVVYWGVSVAIVAAAAVFLFVGPIPDFKESRFSLYIDVKPMDSPRSLLLRGEAPPLGYENYKKGLEEYGKGDYNRAEKLFKRAVNESPDQGEWWLILGVSQVLMSNSADAIQSLTKADQLTSEESRRKTRWFLSQSYLMAEDLDNAVKLLDWLVNERKEYSQDARNLLWKLRDDNVLGAAFSNGPSVISPRGGEIFVFGSPISIRWKDPDPSFSGVYEIWLSKDRGLTCALRIASDIPAGESSWVWETPNEIGNSLAFRIEAVAASARRLGPVSDDLVISPPISLKLLDFNNEAIVYEGFSHEIRWAIPGQIPQHYRLELWSANSGEPSYLRTLATKIEGRFSSWTWQNPNPVGKDYLLRLEAVFTDSSLADFSDRAFVISSRPTISFGQVDYNENDLELSIGWSHTIRNSSQQQLYLRSASNSTETLLYKNFDPIQNSWRGNLTGIPDGTYDIVLKLVFPGGELTKQVGSQITIAGNSDRRASLDDDVQPVEASSFRLKQNYPNPFNASTTIEFELDRSEDIELKVFNMLGQEVKSLLQGRVDAGLHKVQFDASGFASGTYVYQLKADTKTEQKRMTLVK